MLTKKAKYGLKAIVYLANFRPGQPVPVKEIATTQNIPKKFLDAILSELRCAGLVESRMGKGGGYTLALPASEISAGRVIKVIEGTLAPLPCANKERFAPCSDCPDPDNCAVRLVMIDAQRALSDVLEGLSLSEMRAITSAKNGHQLMWHI